jgi:hypothetical protein
MRCRRQSSSFLMIDTSVRHAPKDIVMNPVRISHASRIAAVIVITAVFGLVVPSEARSQSRGRMSRGMYLKMREQQKKEEKKRKEQEAQAKAEKERWEAEQARLMKEKMEKVYEIGLEGTLFLNVFPDGTPAPKNPRNLRWSYYEVHGTILRIAGSGDVDIEVEEQGKKNLRHFKAGEVDQIYRMYESEAVWRVPKAERPKLKVKEFYHIRYHKKGEPVLGFVVRFVPSIFGTGEATEYSSYCIEVEDVLKKWRELGNDDVLGIGYTWTEEWAEAQLYDAQHPKGILDRAVDRYTELTHKERERVNTIVAGGVKAAAKVADAVGSAQPPAVGPNEGKDRGFEKKDKSSAKAAKVPGHVSLTGALVNSAGKPLGKDVQVKAYYPDLSLPPLGLLGAFEDKAWTDAGGKFNMRCPTKTRIQLWVNDKKVWEGKIEAAADIRIICK